MAERSRGVRGRTGGLGDENKKSETSVPPLSRLVARVTCVLDDLDSLIDPPRLRNGEKWKKREERVASLVVMGVTNFVELRKALERKGPWLQLLKHLVAVAPQTRGIVLAFRPDLAPAPAAVAAAAVAAAAAALVAPAPAAPAPSPQAEAPAEKKISTTRKSARVVQQTDKGKEMAEAVRENVARRNADAADVPVGKLLPGADAVAPLDADVAAGIQQLPVDTKKSLFFDGWGCFYNELLRALAAELAGDCGRRKGRAWRCCRGATTC